MKKTKIRVLRLKCYDLPNQNQRIALKKLANQGRSFQT